MADNILDTSKKLYNQILESKFDVETFENIFQKFNELLQPINSQINTLTTELEKLQYTKLQLMKYRDDTKIRIVSEVNIINQKMRRITCDNSESDDDDDGDEDTDGQDAANISNISNASNSRNIVRDNDIPSNVSYLDIAKNANDTRNTVQKSINDGSFENLKMNKSIKIDLVRISSKISIKAIHCVSNTVLNAPIGHLLWLTDKTQFALKIMVGEEPIIFEGNIGNIYVRGDTVSNVDLCRNSKIGRSCTKSIVRFVTNHQKKGKLEIGLALLHIIPNVWHGYLKNTKEYIVLDLERI